ncbi:hypothetical protein HYS54_02695 [Candidatus Micrarchaeota archaeon]|nr:hypothetical protein [Candidatus Micrarchaeota archaeon]
MVFCFVALIVFGVLGIFSAKYRRLAREAFRCAARTVTLRPCDTGFDRRMKNKLVGKLLHVSPRCARLLNRHFRAFSLILAAAMFGSMAYSAVFVYNTVAYGNCNGPNSHSTCFLTGNVSCGSEHCQTNPQGCQCSGRDTNCIAANNYQACDGSCDCNKSVCGGTHDEHAGKEVR